METDWKKKYEEALSLAKSYYGKGQNEFLDTLFPELRESDDERIRQWIANYIHHGVFNEEEHPMALKAIEYLEKQKAKERLDRMAPIYNDKESFESALEKAWKYYNESASRTVDSFEDDYIECVFSKGFREGFLYKEKQKEQKPADSEEIFESVDNAFRRGREVGFHEGVESVKQHTDWSEEDEKRVKQLIYDTEFVKAHYEKRKEELGEQFNNILIEDCDEQIAWLKSLCPQPHWKPSKEQMEWLKSAVRLSTDKPNIHGTIISLYEQLKRL